MTCIKLIFRQARYLTSTGVVWEGCDNISKIPENNKITIQRILVVQHGLINDAFEEISEV